MYRFAKTLHLFGIALFLGSIFAHIVASQLGGAPGTAEFAFARQEIAAATRVLTLPGLALAILSGLWMAFQARLSPLRQRWIAVHGSVAVTILVIAVTLIVPAGRSLLASHSLDQTGAALATERIAGGINILLALANIAIGVWKPRWRRTAVGPDRLR